MAQEKKQGKTDLLGFLAVMLVVVVPFVCGILGFGFGLVDNNEDLSFAYLLTALGAIVGLGLSLGLVLAIRYLRNRRKTRESNKQYKV